MKILQFYICIIFLLSSAVKAQDTIQFNNPFSEARYHYFLKTILFFNEYLDTDSGSFNTTQLRFLHPIANKAWNFENKLLAFSTNM